MEATKFKKKSRDLLLRSAEGKCLLHLLEEVPRNPSMRGLPKVHKPGVPMRPITSGIGSAPHRLAKYLVKPFSGLSWTLIHRGDDGLRFSVYRKPTNKDDYIHYYSAHSNKTKSGVVIAFFLRALRICSPEFLRMRLPI